MATPSNNNLLNRNSFGSEHNQPSPLQRSLLAEAVLLMYMLLTLGILHPQLKIDELSTKQAISDFSTSHLANYVTWVPLAAVASLLVPYQWGRLRNVASLSWPIALLIGSCIVSSLW